MGRLTQTRSVRQSSKKSPDADTAAGRGSPYTARNFTGRGMLLVRGLPLRVGSAGLYCLERPFGSIDPNAIRETELHKESRRRHSRGERESLHSPKLHRQRDAARQRAAATRREQWTVLSGTSTIGHALHVADSLDDRWRLRAGGREQWTVLQLSGTSTIGRT